MMRIAFAGVTGVAALHPLSSLATQTTWQAGDPMTVNVDYDVPSSASFMARKGDAEDYSGGRVQLRITDVGEKSELTKALAAVERRHEERERDMLKHTSFLSESGWQTVTGPLVHVQVVDKAQPLAKDAIERIAREIESKDRQQEQSMIQSHGLRGSAVKTSFASLDLLKNLSAIDAEAVRTHLREKSAFDKLIAAEMASRAQ